MTLLRFGSPTGVTETMDKLVDAVERRGMRIFARIDHAGAARAVGLELADEEVLVFGDPRVGTLLMQSDPEVGYELPIRMLVRDVGGEAQIAYRPASELSKSYRLDERGEVLERIEGVLAELAHEARGRT